MRVLIADDDPISRRLLERTLQLWGYDVTTARDGAEAWRLFGERDFPLVISDWVMPGLDGLELVRRIRASSRPGYVFVILLAAASARREIVEGIVAGADDTKAAAEELSKALKEAWEARLSAGTTAASA